MLRTARSTARRNVWAQISISALVLLLPPMALSAAVYAMLRGHDEAPTPHVANVVADVHAAATGFRTPETLAVTKAQPAAVTPPSPTMVGNPPAAPVPSAPPAFSLASARHDPGAKAATRDPAGKDGGKDLVGRDIVSKDIVSKDRDKDTVKDNASAKDSAKDASRVLGPVPVRVTVVVPPGASPPAATAPAAAAPTAPDLDFTGSVNLEWPRIVAAEPPAAMRAPNIEPPAIQPPSTELPAAETPAPPLAAAGAGGRRHSRFSYLRHLARRSNAYAEARSEVRSTRWGGRTEQQGFSLRNWLFNSAPTNRQRNARS